MSNTEQKNALYWAFNLPLQYWPSESRIVNYMPRKERISSIDLADVLEERSHEEFMNKTADMLENLAKHFRYAATHPDHTIYYPDEQVPTP